MTTPPTTVPSVKLEIASRPELLSSVRSMVISFGERVGLDEIGSGHLALAVDEALANVIRHGYGGRTDGRIWLTLATVDRPEPRIRVEIDDEGRKIDPSKIQPRDLQEVRPGGLGVHIIREVTDLCEFSPRENAGMSLVMEKILPTSPSADVPSIIPPQSDPSQDAP